MPIRGACLDVAVALKVVAPSLSTRWLMPGAFHLKKNKVPLLKPTKDATVASRRPALRWHLYPDGAR